MAGNSKMKFDQHQFHIHERRKLEAFGFLSLHEGRCSVPVDSPLGQTFLAMKEAGQVELRTSETTGYVDVWVQIQVV